jgi:hypothetical protein
VGCCYAARVFSLGSVFLGPLLWQRHNNDVMRSFVESVPKQQPTGNWCGVFLGVRSEGPLPWGHCSIILIKPELQKGLVVKGRHA